MAEENTQVSEVEYLKNNFGVESADELKKLIEKAKNYAPNEELTKRITELETAKTEYEGKYNEANTRLTAVQTEFDGYKSVAKPPANDYVKFVQELAEKGLEPEQIDTALRFRTVDPEKLSDAEVVKLATKIKTPNLTENHINADFQSRFVPQITDETDANYNATERFLKEKQLIEEATKERGFLKDYIGKQFTPKVDVQKQEFEKKYNEAQAYWNTKTPELVKSLNKLKGTQAFSLPGSKGLTQYNVDYEYTVPEKDLESIITQVATDAARGLVPNTQEGEKRVIEYARQQINANYGNKLLEAGLVSANNLFVDVLRKDFHVDIPKSKTNPADGGGGGGAGKTYADSVFGHQGERMKR